MSTHSRKKRKVSPSPPRKVAKKSSPGKPDTPSPGRKASKSVEKAQSPSPKRKAQTPSPRGKTQSPGGKTPSPGVRRAKTESPKRTPGRPKKAESVSRRLATPSPKKKELTPSPKRAAVASVGKKQAATPSPKKQSPASPKKTPPLQSRAKTATPRPKLEERAQSTKIRSAAKGTGRKISTVRSPRTQTAQTPGKRTPVPSAVKSPPKKAVSPTKKTASKAVPSSDVKQEPSATPARRGAGATPKKRVETPTKSTGTRRKSTAASGAGLDTITEVDDVFAEEDAETGVSTRPRHHSLSKESPQTTLAAKPVRLARRSRRVSSGTALDTIAEVPAAEAQEEAATPARRGRGRPSKRMASEQAETTAEPPSSVKEPAPPKKRGRKPTEPPGGDSPPVTRHRLQPQKGRTPTAKSPSSGRGTGKVPKTKRRGRVVIVPVLTGTPGQHAARTRATAGTGTQSTTPLHRATAPRRRYKLAWKQTVLSVPASLSRISSSAASASSTSAGRPSAS